MNGFKSNKIVKRTPGLFIVFGIFMTIATIVIYSADSTDKAEWKSKSVFGYYFMHAFVLGMAIFCWFYVFDKKPLVKINETGIWTRKYKLIEWNDIDAFYTVEKIYSGFKGYRLIIIDKNNGEQSIEFSFADITPELLREDINYYKNKYDFRDSGHITED